MALKLLVLATSLVLAGLLLNLCEADVYIHNPRGSNNRLNGTDANRQNNNRLFDSQNNAKGGYNVGDKTDKPSDSEDTQFNMHYFQSSRPSFSRRRFGWFRFSRRRNAGKSLLTFEWTNQHGCGDQDLNCNFVLQYRCQDDTKHETLNAHSMRNGKETATPAYRKQAFSKRSQKNDRLKTDSSNFARGLHESWEWYDKCAKRNRFEGLFTADQNLNGKTTIYTRQNPNGARSGYECPEERDYYPYWYPTDWIDIAVLTDDTKMCACYKQESFNVKAKEECLEYYDSKKKDGFRHASVHNNKADCENNQGFWVSFNNYLEEYPSSKTEQACKAASSSKLRLIWAVPYRSEDIDNLKMTGGNVESLKRCLVALDPPDCKKTPRTRTNHLGNGLGVIPLRYTWEIPYFPSGHQQRCVLRLRYNISTGDYPPFKTFADKNDRGDEAKSPVQNNPEVKVGNVQLPLQLAINTAQFGRTFQDRSHLFKLVPRPKSVPSQSVIYNLNVRGKRGNIVQAYPAVEYDFFPKRRTISRRNNELIHVQWTGSNTNPQGNAGQGKAGTDRNNMVEMDLPSVNYPLVSGKSLGLFANAEIIWSSDEGTKTNEDLVLSMASSGYYSNVKQYAKKEALNNELDNAPASYRGMLLKFAPGRYYYMCTRNNNFSNRNQKGRLFVGR